MTSENLPTYRPLPHWEQTDNGCKLVTHEGQILGRVEKYVKFRMTLYRAYDERERLMSGAVPMSLPFAKIMVEVRRRLVDEGVV